MLDYRAVMNRRSTGHLIFALAVMFAFAMSAAQVSQRGVHTAKEHVTYSDQIAPLFYDHCTTCHHPGGAGPFSLLTYANARRWGMVIENVTQSRFMPPWLPAPGYGEFADDRRLPDKDLQLIKEWVEAGMPEGNPKDAPKPPVYTSKWVLGPPDIILKVTSPTQIPPSGPDLFINFVLPVPIKHTEYVRALQIIPGSPRVVHHCNIIIDRTDSMRRSHPHTWQKGIPGMEFTFDAGDTFEPDSHFLFWKPDTPALIEPKGMPWRIDPGNDLVLNTHFKPTGKWETAQAEIGLYFTDKPPVAHPMLVQLEHDGALDIPPGDSHFVIEDHLTLPVAVEVLGVYPHAHYLGKRLEGWAVLPNGEKKWLILIPDWDIDRQSVYTYKKPIFLPRGTVLHMRYIYDNSTGNIRNPNSPPIRVRAGNQSTDEMGHLWFQVLALPLPNSKEDPRILLEKAWMENRLRKYANDETALYNLAYVDRTEGNFADAEVLYRRILAGKPNDARSLTALGTAIDASGDWKQAEAEFQKALAADPSYGDAHYDLAQLDFIHDSYAQAAQEYRGLLAENPNDAAAHNGLGIVLMATNQTVGARQQFEATIALDPDNFDALYNLAVIESGDNDLTNAEDLLRRALSQKDDADAHQLLGNLYAQDGQMAAALHQFEAVQALHPTDPLPHREIAEAYEQMGDLASAIRELNAALALDSTNADDWNNLGVAEARAGDRASARKDFEHALSLDPNHAAARANLAKL
jgi:Flp pilus assembly protein TadD/mono/diheme cytochrome c family protein